MGDTDPVWLLKPSFVSFMRNWMHYIQLSSSKSCQKFRHSQSRYTSDCCATISKPAWALDNIENNFWGGYTMVLSKRKGKGLDTCYSSSYIHSHTCVQQHFTISAVEADWHELMILQCIMRPSIAPDSEPLDPWCSTTYCQLSLPMGWGRLSWQGLPGNGPGGSQTGDLSITLLCHGSTIKSCCAF